MSDRTYDLRLVARDDPALPPPEARLKRLLKFAARVLGMRCTRAAEVPQPETPKEESRETDGR